MCVCLPLSANAGECVGKCWCIKYGGISFKFFFLMWIYKVFIEFAVNTILPALCFGFLTIRHVGS